MTHNSLPRRAAMTHTHTRCHAGQRQQPGFAQRRLTMTSSAINSPG